MCIRDSNTPDGFKNNAVLLSEIDIEELKAQGIKRPLIYPVSYTHLDVYKRQLLSTLNEYCSIIINDSDINITIFYNDIISIILRFNMVQIY